VTLVTAFQSLITDTGAARLEAIDARRNCDLDPVPLERQAAGAAGNRVIAACTIEIFFLNPLTPVVLNCCVD
jgi:hypothetical protein